MNLNCKQSIAAQYEIVNILSSGGVELIDDLSKLEEVLQQRIPDFNFKQFITDGLGNWAWAIHALLHVRRLPSYSLIRLGLTNNTDSSPFQSALPQLKAEGNINDSAYDWALCIWLLSEIVILRTSISVDVVNIVVEPLSKYAVFEQRTVFLAQHFIKSKRPAFALPFLFESVRRNPEEVRFRFDLARTQIYAGQYKEALETLSPIEVDRVFEPGKVACNGEPELIAEEAFLRGRALSLIISSDSDIDLDEVWRAYPRMDIVEEARGSLEYAASEFGCEIPEYWYGLGLEGPRGGIEERVRCFDRSLEVSQLRLLLDLQSKATGSQGDLRKLLTGPIMDAAIQRQRLRTFRSLAEWAVDLNYLDDIQHWKDGLHHRIESPSTTAYEWVGCCFDGSSLTAETDLAEFQTMLRIEACQILEIFGIGESEIKLLTTLANNDSEPLVRAAAKKVLASQNPTATSSLVDTQPMPPEEEWSGSKPENLWEEIIRKWKAERQPAKESVTQPVEEGAPSGQVQMQTDDERPSAEAHSSSSPPKKRLLLQIRNLGTVEVPQFVIVNCDGKVWDGTGWYDNEIVGVQYSEIRLAAKVSQDLMRESWSDIQHVEHFTVPIHIEVHSDRNVNVDELQIWLQKSMSMKSNVVKYGHGPTDDTLVMANFDWSELMYVPNSD